jgi:hypothetical protein
MKHLDNVTEVDIPYRMTGFLSVYEQARAHAGSLRHSTTAKLATAKIRVQADLA